MAITMLSQQEPQLVGELTPCSWSTLLSVPDGLGGTRAPTAGEISTLALTVIDLATGAIIHGLDAVPLLSGHGTYNETTGILVINLVAADNPVLQPASDIEKHKAFIHLPTLLWVEIAFWVKRQPLI